MMNKDITTTNGEIFTEADSATLAYMVARRFGMDMGAAAAAWRRMLGNSCPDAAFVELVAKGAESRWY